MKDETLQENDNHLSLSNEEFMIFKNDFLSYSKYPFKSINKDIKKEENLEYNTIKDKQHINYDSFSTNKKKRAFGSNN